jgi:predicted small secreted protein
MKITKITQVILLLCATIALSLASIGCKNTAHGAGKDVENMGEKIQEKTN